MLTRAMEAGEIAPRLGPDAALDALLGPLVYAPLTGASVPRGMIATLVEDVLKPRSN